MKKYFSLRIAILVLLTLFSSSAFSQLPVTHAEKEEFEAIRLQYENKFIDQSLEAIKEFRGKYPGSFYEEDLLFYEGVILNSLGKKQAGLEILKLFNSTFTSSKYRESSMFYQAGSEADLKLSDDSLNTIDLILKEFPKTKYLSQVIFYKAKASFYKEDWNSVLKNIEQITDRESLTPAQQGDLSFIIIWSRVELSEAGTEQEVVDILSGSDHTDEQKVALASLFIKKFYNKKMYIDAIGLAEQALDSIDPASSGRAQLLYLSGLSLFSLAAQSKAPSKNQAESKKVADSSQDASTEALPDSTADTSDDTMAKPDASGSSSTDLTKNSTAQPDSSSDSSGDTSSDPNNAMNFSLLDQSLEKHLANLSEKEPFNKFGSLFQAAEVYLFKKDYEKSLRNALIILHGDTELKEDPELYLLLFKLYKQKNMDAEALLHMNSALKFTTDREGTNALNLTLIRNLYQMKKCDDVIDNAKKALATYDSTADSQAGKDEIISYQGSCHLENKKYKAAVKSFSQVSKDSEFFSLNLKNYIFALQKTGDKKTMNALLDNVSEEQFTNSGIESNNVLLVKLKNLSDQGKWKSVVLTAQNGLKSATEQKHLVYYYLALGQLETGDKVAAEASFWESFKKSPDNDSDNKLTVATKLISIYEKGSDLKKLIDTYEVTLKYVKDTKQQSEIMFFIAESYADKLNNKNSALKWYLKTYKTGRYPYNVEASLKAADIYLNKDKFANALKILETIIKRKLEKTLYYPLISFKLGSIYHYQEKYKLAAKFYNNTIKSSPKSEEGKTAKIRLAEIDDYLEK